MTKPPNCIYIGPNVPSLGLKKNTIYRSDTMPDTLSKIAVTRPVVRSLFVSTADLAAATKNLGKKGTLEYVASEELRSMAKALHH
jgi:hypothetical protein